MQWRLPVSGIVGLAAVCAASTCLSTAAARCEVRGKAVRVACWVAAEADALVIEVTDEREPPQPVEVQLAMWREPEVRAARRGVCVAAG